MAGLFGAISKFKNLKLKKLKIGKHEFSLESLKSKNSDLSIKDSAIESSENISDEIKSDLPSKIESRSLDEILDDIENKYEVNPDEVKSNVSENDEDSVDSLIENSNKELKRFKKSLDKKHDEGNITDIEYVKDIFDKVNFENNFKIQRLNKILFEDQNKVLSANIEMIKNSMSTLNTKDKESDKNDSMINEYLNTELTKIEGGVGSVLGAQKQVASDVSQSNDSSGGIFGIVKGLIGFIKKLNPTEFLSGLMMMFILGMNQLTSKFIEPAILSIKNFKDEIINYLDKIPFVDTDGYKEFYEYITGKNKEGKDIYKKITYRKFKSGEVKIVDVSNLTAEEYSAGGENVKIIGTNYGESLFHSAGDYLRNREYGDNYRLSYYNENSLGEVYSSSGENFLDAEASGQTYSKPEDFNNLQGYGDIEYKNETTSVEEESKLNQYRSGYSGTSKDIIYQADANTPAANIVVERQVAARDTVNFFVNKGYPLISAVAIAGNLYGESSLDPGVKGDVDKGGSFGLAQWNVNAGRFDKLKEFARTKGSSWDDFYTQLEFVDHELKNNFKDVHATLMNPNSKLGESIYQLVYKYEIPQKKQEETIRRIGLAKGIYQIYKGGEELTTDDSIPWEVATDITINPIATRVTTVGAPGLRQVTTTEKYIGDVYVENPLDQNTQYLVKSVQLGREIIVRGTDISKYANIVSTDGIAGNDEIAQKILNNESFSDGSPQKVIESKNNSTASYNVIIESNNTTYFRPIGTTIPYYE